MECKRGFRLGLRNGGLEGRLQPLEWCSSVNGEEHCDVVSEMKNALEGGGKAVPILKRWIMWSDCFPGLVLGSKVTVHDEAGTGRRCFSENH